MFHLLQDGSTCMHTLHYRTLHSIPVSACIDFVMLIHDSSWLLSQTFRRCTISLDNYFILILYDFFWESSGEGMHDFDPQSNRHCQIKPELVCSGHPEMFPCPTWMGPRIPQYQVSRLRNDGQKQGLFNMTIRTEIWHCVTNAKIKQLLLVDPVTPFKLHQSHSVIIRHADAMEHRSSPHWLIQPNPKAIVKPVTKQRQPVIWLLVETIFPNNLTMKFESNQ